MNRGSGLRAARTIQALVAGAALCAAAPPPMPGSIIGLWENPHATVKIQTRECGREICGWIVWASAEATRDALASGVQKLVGTEVLRDYRQTASGKWEGEVFVPDMDGTYFSKIRQLGERQLKVSGCILHGLICKSQLWHRL